jgi:hypothetical protein
MQFVCDEIGQRAKWFYEPDNKTFYKIWDTGEPDKKIRGINLPDPADLMGKGRDPTPVTRRLFEFWQGVKDA